MCLDTKWGIGRNQDLSNMVTNSPSPRIPYLPGCFSEDHNLIHTCMTCTRALDFCGMRAQCFMYPSILQCFYYILICVCVCKKRNSGASQGRGWMQMGGLCCLKYMVTLVPAWPAPSPAIFPIPGQHAVLLPSASISVYHWFVAPEGSVQAVAQSFLCLLTKTCQERLLLYFVAFL